MVLVALKCDLRPSANDEEDATVVAGAGMEPKRPAITYAQGLEVAKRIRALRYLGMRHAAFPDVHSLATPTNIQPRMLCDEEPWCE